MKTDTIYIYICSSLLSIMCFGACSGAYAQSTMSGGGYSLDGGITVFTGVEQAGGYSVANTGDPITAQNASGGSYTLSPSPFDIPTIPSSGSGGGSQGGGGAVSGYTQFPSQPQPQYQPVSPEESVHREYEYIRKAIVYPDTLHIGTIWEDTGEEFGSSSIGKGSIYPQSTAQKGQGEIGGQREKEGQEVGGKMRFRTYILFTSEQKKVIAMIIFLLAWTRLFKRKTESHMRKTGGSFTLHEVPLYTTSRYPIAIMIDGIIALHRNISMRDIRIYSHQVRKMTWNIGILVGNGIVSALSVILAIWLYRISPIFTLIFSAISIVRFIIWYRL